jgi:hypothetical protein
MKKHQFHAVARLNMKIKQLESGNLQGCLPSGAVFGLRVPVHVRQHLKLGWCEATVHVRTTRESKLKGSGTGLFLVEAEPLQMLDMTAVDGVFSFAGKVVAIDNRSGDPRVIVRVFPEHAKIDPFVVSALLPKEVLKLVQNPQFVYVTGELVNGVMVARAVHEADMRVGERWKGYKPGTYRTYEPQSRVLVGA